jgi:hypothetical protein
VKRSALARDFVEQIVLRDGIPADHRPCMLTRRADAIQNSAGRKLTDLGIEASFARPQQSNTTRSAKAYSRPCNV